MAEVEVQTAGLVQQQQPARCEQRASRSRRAAARRRRACARRRRRGRRAQVRPISARTGRVRRHRRLEANRDRRCRCQLYTVSRTLARERVAPELGAPGPTRSASAPGCPISRAICPSTATSPAERPERRRPVRPAATTCRSRSGRGRPSVRPCSDREARGARRARRPPRSSSPARRPSGRVSRSNGASACVGRTCPPATTGRPLRPAHRLAATVRLPSRARRGVGAGLISALARPPCSNRARNDGTPTAAAMHADRQLDRRDDGAGDQRRPGRRRPAAERARRAAATAAARAHRPAAAHAGRRNRQADRAGGGRGRRAGGERGGAERDAAAACRPARRASPPRRRRGRASRAGAQSARRAQTRPASASHATPHCVAPFRSPSSQNTMPRNCISEASTSSIETNAEQAVPIITPTEQQRHRRLPCGREPPTEQPRTTAGRAAPAAAQGAGASADRDAPFRQQQRAAQRCRASSISSAPTDAAAGQPEHVTDRPADCGSAAASTRRPTRSAAPARSRRGRAERGSSTGCPVSRRPHPDEPAATPTAERPPTANASMIRACDQASDRCSSSRAGGRRSGRPSQPCRPSAGIVAQRLVATVERRSAARASKRQCDVDAVPRPAMSAVT